MSTLIVSAAKFEVEPLLERLETTENQIQYVEAQVGSIKSARSSGMLFEKAKGKDVIFIGSCGVFGEFIEPTLVRAKKTVWLPTCERVNIAYSINGVDEPFTLPKPPTWTKDIEEATVICASTISKTSEISDESAIRAGINKEKDLLVENLELYSVAEVLASSAKSFVSIFAITNAVGSNSHKQWKVNFKKAATLTSDYIINKLFSI